jgi:N6-adenosine-specific RNA methylase IME4
MNRYNVICIDCPWTFSDKLEMSEVARGAESNYPVLNIEELKKLKINELAADDAIIVSWTPSSLLQEGLDLLKSWKFNQKQMIVWNKTVKEPFKSIKNKLKNIDLSNKNSIDQIFDQFNYQEIMGFGMGRLWRNCHEVALVGTRGKIYKHLKNKSQRTVHFSVNEKHSKKPETIQDQLDLMFPDPSLKRIEVFARRIRPGWTCIGNEISSGEDIRDSIDKLLLQGDS